MAEGPTRQFNPEVAERAAMREVGQRAVEEVAKRLRTADMRAKCLGLAIESNTGKGLEPLTLIAQAEVFMAWIITGERPEQP